MFFFSFLQKIIVTDYFNHTTVIYYSDSDAAFNRFFSILGDLLNHHKRVLGLTKNHKCSSPVKHICTESILYTKQDWIYSKYVVMSFTVKTLCGCVIWMKHLTLCFCMWLLVLMAPDLLRTEDRVRCCVPSFPHYWDLGVLLGLIDSPNNA